MHCVDIMNGSISAGENPELEALKNKIQKAKIKKGCLNERCKQEKNSSTIFNIFFSQAKTKNFNITTSSINSASSLESDDEDKKEKKDTSAAVFGAGAAVMGLIGLGVYVWDYCQFKQHPQKGCDYWLDSNGVIQTGALYETHQASVFNASTIIEWPNFHFESNSMKIIFPHFYSDGIIGHFPDRVFIYGRDFTSLYNAVAEKFYMKEVDTNGQCLNSFVLPTKSKKIIYSNGSFVMLSYDGYVYFKAQSSNTFERLYIKTRLNYFFEETVIDIVSSNNCIVLWTHSGQLIKVLMDPINKIFQLSTVTAIPMNERKKYRIVDCQNGSFSLAKSDVNAVLSSKDYSVDFFTTIDPHACNSYTPINEQIIHFKTELSFFKRLLYEGYRFIVNRPLKCMSFSCFGLSLFLYMKYLKKR